MIRLGLICGLSLCSYLASTSCLWAGGTAKYFVLIVWDGMRPDFVSSELTPTLHKLRESGVWFAQHHSVYPTSTEVNGAVLATGMFPQHNGVLANKEYRKDIAPLAEFGTESLKAVRRGDELTGNKYLQVPTIAERVRTGGGRTAVVGAKPVALLHDRLPRGADSLNPVWFVNGCLPESRLAGLTNEFGVFPSPVSPNVARDTWATRCLSENFWRGELPRYSVLWLSEPDYSQHHHGPGSSQALDAIRNCDQLLASLLAELDRRRVRAETDILVVSDHGVSTIEQNGDMAAVLRAGGINARPAWDDVPRPDDVVVVGNGGSVLLYVIGHSPATIEQVITTLQRNPQTGVLFTRTALSGTFPLAEVSLDAATAPDVIVASAWRKSDGDGAPLRVKVGNDGYSEYSPGGGMHVTLSPTDLHNLAVAAGPDFREGVVSTLASGNVDIVPTLLWLMDLKPKEKLDGRVLGEALKAKQPIPAATPGVRNARREFPEGIWEQYLRFTEVDGVRYLEEGNGSWRPASKVSSPAQRTETVSPRTATH